MRCTLAICSESTALDNQSNSLSIFNIFEDIVYPQFPVVMPKMTISFIVEKDESEGEELNGFVVMASNGQEVMRHPISANFLNKTRMRLVLTVGGVVIPAPGNFTASLLINEQVLGKWEIGVKQVGMPQPQVVAS